MDLLSAALSESGVAEDLEDYSFAGDHWTYAIKPFDANVPPLTPVFSASVYFKLD